MLRTPCAATFPAGCDACLNVSIAGAHDKPFFQSLSKGFPEPGKSAADPLGAGLAAAGPPS